MKPFLLALCFGFGLTSLGLSQTVVGDSVPALAKDLGGPNGEFAAAQLALKGMEGEKALVLCAKDPDPLVRFRALEGLRESLDPAALDLIVHAMDDRDRDVSTKAFQLLKSGGPVAMEAIVRGIGEVSGPSSGELMLFALTNGADGEKRFQQILDSGSLTARTRAIGFAGNLFFPKRPDLFQSLAQTPSPEIRQALIQAVNTGELSKEEEPFVIGLLKDEDPAIRIEGLAALHRSPHPPLDPFFEAIRDPSPAVQKEALKDLDQLPARPDVIAREAELVTSKDRRISDTFVRYLAEPAANAVEMSGARSRADARLAGMFASTDLPRLKEVLFHRLKTGDSPVSARLLGYLGDPRAFLYLMRQLPFVMPLRQDANQAVFGAIAFSNSELAEPVLATFLGQGYDTNVIIALGNTRSEAAVTALIRQFQTRRDKVWLGDSLASLGDQKATPMMIAYARDPSVSVQDRGNMLFRIGELGGPGVVDLMADVLDDPTLQNIHWQASAGLKAITDLKAIPDLQRAVKERKGESAKEAAAALTRLTSTTNG